MATNGSDVGGSRVPDAWNDDDWLDNQKKVASKPAEQGDEASKSPTPLSGKPPIILAKKPNAGSASVSADEITTHMQNIQIWNAANEGGSGFEVVTNATQPNKTLYRPERTILKRATATDSPERDPNKQGSGTPKSDAGSETEAKKETPQEKMERERREKEERYAKARQRLFGPDSSSGAGGDSMEKTTSSNGKSSGTTTPAAGKSANPQNKNVPSRKASPNSRQRRRERIDDDFVPRSAMIAGTVESYQLDQQLQAEAQLREMQSRAPHYPQNMPQPQFAQPQPYNPGQGGNFVPRQPAGNSPWNNSFSPPGMPPQPHQFNQYQGQNQHPGPYPAPQQQQAPPQSYQAPYMPPFHAQPSTGGMPNQGPPQQPQGLYDPNYSQKPPGNLQFFNQNNQAGPPAQFPVREPKAPDGTGRGGFGFATRGGGAGMAQLPHPPVPHPQGRGFSNVMFPGNNAQNAHGGQGVGFNSPAAAAPWGVTNPNALGSQRPGQIWSNGSNGGAMNGGDQNYPGPQPQPHQHQHQPQHQPMGGPYPALGHNSVWGNNPGTWNNAGGGGPGGQGQGIGRGKR
ncbi:hypothetical protein DRE_07703 [Drechslerella stenobrocha 248]|uniref:SUZ domain-containing protein n=1 Tax=Drechslerella stenobrocha 248 TaxID=1043628 RepID=W7HSD5_9PEZI|nr:hypothetical protein DRE_07703 [Drechslerella stenobrocha 248]